MQGLQKLDQDGRQQVKNGGANLGYAYSTDQMGFRFDVGYLNNMADVNLISKGLVVGYNKRVGGLSAGLDFRYSMFDFGARYVSALSKFSEDTNSGLDNSEPTAYGLTAGVTFPVMAHQSRFGLGYQHTKDISLFGKNRYYGEYAVNISKWTDVGLAVIHDRASGENATAGIARLSVKFA